MGRVSLGKSIFNLKKRILRFFTKQIDQRSLRSCYIKGTKESLLTVDSSVPLLHLDLSDLGLICLVKKHKICFGCKNPILDFPKICTLRTVKIYYRDGRCLISKIYVKMNYVLIIKEQLAI